MRKPGDFGFIVICLVGAVWLLGACGAVALGLQILGYAARLPAGEGTYYGNQGTGWLGLLIAGIGLLFSAIILAIFHSRCPGPRGKITAAVAAAAVVSVAVLHGRFQQTLNLAGKAQAQTEQDWNYITSVMERSRTSPRPKATHEDYSAVLLWTRLGAEVLSASRAEDSSRLMALYETSRELPRPERYQDLYVVLSSALESLLDDASYRGTAHTKIRNALARHDIDLGRVDEHLTPQEQEELLERYFPATEPLPSSPP